jgi:hypothetical protein
MNYEHTYQTVYAPVYEYDPVAAGELQDLQDHYEAERMASERKAREYADYLASRRGK